LRRYTAFFCSQPCSLPRNLANAVSAVLLVTGLSLSRRAV